VIGSPADTHDPPVLHCDVKATAVGAQHAGRMHPRVRFALDTEIGVDPGLHMIFPRHQNAKLPLLTELSSLLIPHLMVPWATKRIVDPSQAAAKLGLNESEASPISSHEPSM